MFYIHGGALATGSGDPDLHGPEMLLDNDLILIVSNYRLGALGFLSTEDEVVPGNMGLKDQNLALQWVKRNVVHFGGNPNKITIFGHSSGAETAHLHVLSPLSKDLISGAILNSGNALISWILAPKGRALQNAKRLAEYLNCTTNSNREMVECLNKIDASEIIAQEHKFYVFSYFPSITFRAVIEIDHENAFISKDPVVIIKRGESARVPILTGIATNDGATTTSLIYTNSTSLAMLKKNFNTLLPVVFDYQDNPKKDEITRIINAVYFGGKGLDGENSKEEFTKLSTDIDYLISDAEIINLHVTYTDYPVYHYVFGLRGTLSYTQLLGDTNYGVCHGDELFYLFKSHFKTSYTDEEKKYIDILTTLWGNFVATGNPTPTTNNNSLIKNKWEPTQRKVISAYFLKSADDIKMENDMYKERIEFWKLLAINYPIPEIVKAEL